MQFICNKTGDEGRIYAARQGMRAYNNNNMRNPIIKEIQAHVTVIIVAHFVTSIVKVYNKVLYTSLLFMLYTVEWFICFPSDIIDILLHFLPYSKTVYFKHRHKLAALELQNVKFYLCLYTTSLLVYLS